MTATTVSPCRIGLARTDHPDQRRRVHVCSAEHASTVEGYRAARAVWERDADDASLGYASELVEWRKDHPAPTFRAWLTSSAMSAAPVVATVPMSDAAFTRMAEQLGY